MRMPGFQEQIAIDDQGKRQAGPVGQRGLHIHAAVDQAVAHHGKPVAGTAADGLKQVVFTP